MHHDYGNYRVIAYSAVVKVCQTDPIELLIRSFNVCSICWLWDGDNLEPKTFGWQFTLYLHWKLLLNTWNAVVVSLWLDSVMMARFSMYVNRLEMHPKGFPPQNAWESLENEDYWVQLVPTVLFEVLMSKWNNNSPTAALFISSIRPMLKRIAFKRQW